MENDSEKQLAELIHRELRKLPELRAPDTLIPRVRAALTGKTRQPWWQRPLVTWPLGLRLSFIALLLGSLGAAGFYGAEISHGLDFVVQKTAQSFASFVPLWERLASLANAVLVLFRALGSHFLIYAAVLLGVMYLACVGIGTLCFRVAFVKR